jgi:hypothetical protein
VYLKALTQELKAAGVIAEDVDAGSVDELLGVLERTSGGTARLIDTPPLELKGMRASLAELRSHADSLPTAEELAALYAGSAGRRRTRTARSSKCRPASAWHFSARPRKCPRRTSSCRIARTGSPYATRAFPPTPAG